MNLKTIIAIAFSCLVLLTYTRAQEKPLPDWNGRSCAVVLTYDDGLNVHLDKVIPVLDSLGFRATFYVPCNSPSLAKRLNEWRTIALHGHELGNHTLFHPCFGKSQARTWVKPEYDLDTYTMPRMIDEIRLANAFLQAIDGKKERTFAYTCGDNTIGNVSFVDSIRNDFVGARGVKAGMNQKSNPDLFDIMTYTVDGQTADELTRLADQAIIEHTLLVFLFHGVGGEHPMTISLPQHNKLMRYLKKSEKDIWVAPMVEVSTYIRKSQAKK